jgi:hypothetical protein
MSEAIRYNATKVVGEYGSVARLQHRLHLAPDPKGNWVKWEDYAFLKMEVERLKNNVAYLDKKLDEELGEDDDGGDSYNHPHAFGK